MKERKVINALLTIKEYCESNNCRTCMFGKGIGQHIFFNYTCKIFEGNEPKNWKVEVKINE